MVACCYMLVQIRPVLLEGAAVKSSEGYLKYRSVRYFSIWILENTIWRSLQIVLTYLSRPSNVWRVFLGSSSFSRHYFLHCKLLCYYSRCAHITMSRFESWLLLDYFGNSFRTLTFWQFIIITRRKVQSLSLSPKNRNEHLLEALDSTDLDISQNVSLC